MKKFLFCLLLSACTTTFPGSGTTPPPVQTPPSIAQATNFAGKVISQTEIDLSWNDQSAGAASYQVESISTVGRENHTSQILPAGSVSFKAIGLNASWQYDFTLSTLDASGVVVGSPSIITVQTLLPVATTPPPVTTPPVATPPASGQAPAVCTNYNVHPGDDYAAFAKSTSATLICFAPGNYVVPGTDAASTHIPGAGKVYNGSGHAVFVKGPADAKLSLDGGGELLGFTFDGVVLSIEGSGDNVHDNKFPGDTVENVNGLSNSHVDHNSFFDGGIGGFPGSNNTFDYNNYTFPNRTDNQEAIHIIGAISNISVSHNVIVGTRLRWGIELQEGMHNLTVNNNYISTGVGATISCATGGDATPPYGNQGEDITIANNYLISPPFTANCGLEIMGDKGILITNNVFSGMNTGILNGSGGQQNQPVVYSNNSFIASNQVSVEQFTWTVPPIVSVNNKNFAKGDPNAPVIPPIPTDAGARL